MANEVTVFRSADSGAEQDATAVSELLRQEGIASRAVDDNEPGVLEGTWEVRVAEADAPRAEALINASPVDDELVDVDPSHDLDLVTIFETAGGETAAQIEVDAIVSLLESEGIATVVNSGPVPAFPREIRVAKEHAERAREIIRDAQEV
jgi:hypothetical protein